ncbi:prepilin peptidase [Candidatus Woesearchaeota archaeon]|nr:prepilin peptidase [Candidatus Woesearchaeota archaeon]
MQFLDVFNLVNVPTLIPYLIAFIVLVVGSYTDLRTREVPDWINLGTIGIGFSISLILSLVYWNHSFILNSVIGFGIFFGIAWLMFYTGQWGGGDSKMLMGLGALIGIDVFSGKLPFLVNFFINSMLVGAIYGLLWSFYLALVKRKKFVVSFKKTLEDKKTKKFRNFTIIFIVIFVSLFLFDDSLYRILYVYAALLAGISFYLFVSVKAVEKSCMLKLVTPDKLTEGDWIAKEVKVSGKYITGPKDLGIEKKQIKKLISLYKKKKVRKILVKEGIPFVPSFLIAFIVTLVMGNLVLLFL